MVVVANPAFPQYARNACCVVTAAKTTYNDAANAVLLDTAGGALGNYSEYVRINAMPRATVAATQMQLFIYDLTNYWFVGSVLMPAYTMAQTTLCLPTPFQHMDGSTISPSNPLYLQNGHKLYVASGVALAAGIVCSAQVRDY